MRIAGCIGVVYGVYGGICMSWAFNRIRLSDRRWNLCKLQNSEIEAGMIREHHSKTSGAHFHSAYMLTCLKKLKPILGSFWFLENRFDKCAHG